MKSPITQRPTVLRVPQRASGGQARPSDGVDFFYVWHQPPTDEFPTVSEASFEVERIEVNERRLAICTTKNVDEDRLLVTCRDERLSELVGQRVRVEATFKVKVPKRAHRIHLSVPVPAHADWTSRSTEGHNVQSRLVICISAHWWQRNSYDRLPPPCNLTDGVRTCSAGAADGRRAGTAAMVGAGAGSRRSALRAGHVGVSRLS